jgi:F0F1-type ATP synthase assembly protein I
MIRSLFDTEDEKSEKAEEIINESPKTEISDRTKSAKNVEMQQFPVVETSETQPVSNESAAEKEERPKKNPPENIESSEIQTVSDFESGNVVKDIEFGDNLLELEKEVTRIENEVRLESESKIAQESRDAEIQSTSENTFSAENQSEPEKNELLRGEIFTAAINKSEQEKPTSQSLENLLFMPSETPPDSEVSPNENQSFILPNRTETPDENTFLTQTIETPQTDYKPASKAEIIRNSGLAWSAGIVFFGSVTFLLILGWFADLLLGSSPWGAVGGVVLGSIIGFLQLFRLTSQILKNNE